MTASWTKQETLLLIEEWGDERVQTELNTCKHNQEIYSKIAAELSKAGFERSHNQCNNKIKKLKADYRKVKDK